MKRAYAVLQIKAVDEGARKFSGVASTVGTDRMGDIVEPKGAQFKLPLPLLWQHDSRDPIGWVTRAKVTNDGIEIEGEIAKIEEPGRLQDRLTEAWQYIKNKLVRGLSIGFNALESARIEGTYGIHFTAWEWLELSAVTIPANQEATITAIKSLAAPGRQPPGVPGNRSRKEATMKTLQELIEERAQKAARLAELSDLVKRGEKRNYTDDEAGEVDTLLAEIEQLDGDIRTKRIEAAQLMTAKGVDGSSAAAASVSRGPTILIRKQDPDDKFKGQAFTRRAIAKALAWLSNGEFTAGQIAEHRWGKSNPQLVEWIKGDVSAATAGDAAWAGRLVAPDGRFAGDFIEYLKSKTVYDQLALREVPANVTIKGQDGIGSAGWVGQAHAIPVSEQGFTTINLTPLKVAGIAVLANEIIRDSSPSAEMLVRDGLVTAIADAIDSTFLSDDPADAGVSPAGLLAALAAISSTGTDGIALRRDIAALYAPFLTAKNASGLNLVMTTTLAKSISLMVNALGQTEFPGITADGGTLLGDRTVTGDHVPAGAMILLKPSDIWRIGDGGVTVSISQDATLEMETEPAMEGATPTGPTGKMVSMFQTESTAFKVVRPINFQKRRTTAVQWIDDAAYAPTPAETT